MQLPDEELEKYLRKFRPRAVRRLEVRRHAGNPWRLRLAMAAVVVLTATVSLWHPWRKATKPPDRVTLQAVPSIAMPQTRMSTPALTKLALDDSAAFDALLARQSGTVFPSMRGEQSALRVLAKE